MESLLHDDPRHRFFGLYPALVTDVVDPARLGRIEVGFPFLGGPGEDVRAWATLLSTYADDDQGIQILPEVGSQVVVGFEAGELARPYVVGACWNGRAAPPVTATRPNDKRVWKTRSGSILEFDDVQGAAKVSLRTRSGHRLVLDEGAQQVELAHANGATLTIDAAGKVAVQAMATVDVTAAAVNVHAPSATFDGVVTCSTLIAQAGVVSPSYTPGAGNIW